MAFNFSISHICVSSHDSLSYFFILVLRIVWAIDVLFTPNIIGFLFSGYLTQCKTSILAVVVVVSPCHITASGQIYLFRRTTVMASYRNGKGHITSSIIFSIVTPVHKLRVFQHMIRV